MFLTILINITLPVFLLIGIGVFLDRTLDLNINTLTRLSFNLFLPALVFIKTFDAGLSPELFGIVTLINLIHTALIFSASWLLFSLAQFRAQRPVLTLAGILPNAGNYGIPLATIAYAAAGANVMAIIVMLQIVVTVTAGIYVIDSGNTRRRDMLYGALKVPLLWSCVAGVSLAALKVELPAPLRISFDYLANGLVPLALVTLGIQLSRSRLGGRSLTLPAVTIFRLVLSPLLAWGLVLIWTAVFKMDLGVTGKILVIGAGMPTAVNVFILASEYNRDSELASQAILWTTLFSALSLTAWLAVLQR